MLLIEQRLQGWLRSHWVSRRWVGRTFVRRIRHASHALDVVALDAGVLGVAGIGLDGGKRIDR